MYIYTYTYRIAKNVIILLQLFKCMCTLSNGWARDVWNDIKFISLFDKFKNLCDCQINTLINTISGDPKLFARSVKKLFYCDFLALSQFTHANDNAAPHIMQTDQQDAVAEVEPPPAPYTTTLNNSFPCSICNAVLNTYQKYKAHVIRKHTIRDPICTYIDGTVCRVCRNNLGHGSARSIIYATNPDIASRRCCNWAQSGVWRKRIHGRPKLGHIIVNCMPRVSKGFIRTYQYFRLWALSVLFIL